ncbi:unnamed protein product, partial [Meganyctiphanes norvegica]
ETLRWVKKEGSVKEMERRSKEKSSLLYALIDESNGFYCNPVDSAVRSRMNVVFRVGGKSGNEDLEKAFLDAATKEGLLSLKGHRSVGGIRASIYNAITINDVTRLANFMKTFRTNNQ